MNRRINSGDKNVIGHSTQIHGNLILGDDSGNSDKNSKTKSSNNNTKSSDTKSNNSNSANLDAFVDNCRFNSGDKNVIGHNTQIDGNPIVGDNSGNSDNPVVKGNIDKIDGNAESRIDSWNLVFLANVENVGAKSNNYGHSGFLNKCWKCWNKIKQLWAFVRGLPLTLRSPPSTPSLQATKTNPKAPKQNWEE